MCYRSAPFLCTQRLFGLSLWALYGREVPVVSIIQILAGYTLTFTNTLLNFFLAKLTLIGIYHLTITDPKLYEVDAIK